jgi:hypothetical protein
MNTKQCPTCGGPLIQKNSVQLILAGIAFIAIGGLLMFLNFKFWPLSGFLGVIAVYLIAWGTRGKGLWCRHCKTVPFK